MDSWNEQIKLKRERERKELQEQNEFQAFRENNAKQHYMAQHAEKVD